MSLIRKALLLAISPAAWGQTPSVTLVANAEGENPLIAPNTWVELKGANLSKAGDSRIWQTSDFVKNQLPTTLDGVSVTVNGKSAYVYYISPTQVNILTPPDAMQGSVAVVVTNNAATSAPFTVQAQAISPSFFLFNGGPYVASTHVSGALLGPASLYPGSTTPAKPGETVVIYANGFGPTSTAVVSGSETQSGSLSPSPVVTIGGIAATVTFAGLVAPGEFQVNVVVPANAPSGDNPIIATYNGSEASPAGLITIEGTAPSPTSVTFYVSPTGSDYWSGTLPAPNSNNTDGPFASFDHARAIVQSISKTGLTQISVQFRAGTYYLPSAEMFTAADSGSPTLQIVYQGYPGDVSPVISGGMRVQSWTNSGGNTWKTTLPASTQYFENLFYNGVRRLRPRLGGYLGTYYRVAAPVNLNAAAPPAAAPNVNCSVYVSGSGWECFDRFQYAAADPVSSTWKNLAPAAGNLCGQPTGNQALIGDIELLAFEKYTASKLRISCVDATNHIVYLTGPALVDASLYTAQGFIATHRYLVENIQDELTQAGQWFLDRSTSPWTITYLANPGENPNTDTVIVPQRTEVLVASDLQYVAFQGLTFEHDNYTIPAQGHADTELPYDVSAAVSFQNSQHITFNSSVVTQTSGAGLEFISCLNPQLITRCVSGGAASVTANNVIENSAFYDLGEDGVRIGIQNLPVDTDANVPQFTTVQNNVVEGYGRVFPNAWGIAQGDGHDNTYTHNDVYDGYHAAIGACQCTAAVPNSHGTFNNTISFNHVYNLFQGLMNDGGSLYFGVGNAVFTAAGNKILNNKVHDVSDASVQDADGYGGHGIYLDDQTGLTDVENNLVYRVSDAGINFPGAPFAPNLQNTVKNNIFAFARLAMMNNSNFFLSGGIPASADQVFVATSNLMYFDRSFSSSPAFSVQGGCTYTGGFPYTAYQQWTSNLYWRTDGAFASDTQTFHVQLKPGTAAPCDGGVAAWTFYTFAGWQKNAGEDAQSVVQNPGFNNPAYPADDYSLPKGSPGVGFVVFDPTQAGRSNPILQPPAIAATFPTKTFNPATDF